MIKETKAGWCFWVGSVWFDFILIKNTSFSTFSKQNPFIIDIHIMFPFGEVEMRNSCGFSKSHEVQLTFFLLSIFCSVSNE